MAIKISGTTVIDNSRNISNITDASVSGNATFTGILTVPTGNTSQRPVTPAPGQLRFNTETSQLETYNGSSFAAAGGGGGGRDFIFFMSA
jgi:hypothetical protein